MKPILNRSSVLNHSDYSQQRSQKHSQTQKHISSYIMVAITPTPDENQSTLPETLKLYDISTGRTWSREALDHFVVGRIHGDYGWDRLCVLLGRAHQNFTGVTIIELQGFWNTVLPNTNILHWWNSKATKGVQVQVVLEDIESVLDDADNNYENYKIQ